MTALDHGEELVVDAEPDAASRARRFLTAGLRHVAAGEAGATAARLLDDAHVVVTELVTNAQLHGSSPITVRVRTDPRHGGIRIEVCDRGGAPLVMPAPTLDAMTGRGLTLVTALSVAWGVEPGADGGKCVWATLPVGGTPGATGAPAQRAGSVDLAELVDAFPDDAAPAPTAAKAGGPDVYEVRIGSVPTDLLLDAEHHIDNVVRELTLERASTAEQPPELRTLIDTITTDFAVARAGIKHQAIAAAARGLEETELVLVLPVTAADAGERYLAALDEADAYSRAARLLTLETPPLHRVFRTWSVNALAEQLRALAAGQPPPRPRSFVRVLSDEVTVLSELRVTADRLAMLQKVQRELTAAHGQAQICDVVIKHARTTLGALSGSVYLSGPDDELRWARTQGSSSPAVQTYQHMKRDADLPGPLVFRTGTPFVARSLAHLAERFPALSAVYDTERSLHVVPLVVGAHRLGVLSLTFPPGGKHDEQTLSEFVQTLADALAQALERDQASTSAAEAADRLAFLADASVALTASLDVGQTIDSITALLVPRLADLCTLVLLEDGVLRTVALRHRDPAKETWAWDLARTYTPPADAPVGDAHVMRTGVSELHEVLTDEMLVAGAVDARHLEALREVGMRSAMAVPLPGRHGTLGVLSLIRTDASRPYGASDVAYVEDVARRAAMALETARLVQEQSGRLADVTRIADAAQKAILAPPPSRVGPISLAARYVSAAADALVGGDLYETVSRPGAVRMIIGDVRGKGLGAVRTATVVLGEFRAAAADLDDLADVARQIDRRLRPYLGQEDFVTALLAEIRDDGDYLIASCGHPPALLASPDRGTVTPLHTTATLPLGLGADPTVIGGRLAPGDRLLLHTDGILEARGPDGEFVDLLRLVQPLTEGRVDRVLDEVLDGLHAAVGTDLGDDLALLVAEYAPTRAPATS